MFCPLQIIKPKCHLLRIKIRVSYRDKNYPIPSDTHSRNFTEIGQVESEVNVHKHHDTSFYKAIYYSVTQYINYGSHKQLSYEGLESTALRRGGCSEANALNAKSYIMLKPCYIHNFLLTEDSKAHCRQTNSFKEVF